LATTGTARPHGLTVQELFAHGEICARGFGGISIAGAPPRFRTAAPASSRQIAIGAATVRIPPGIELATLQLVCATASCAAEHRVSTDCRRAVLPLLWSCAIVPSSAGREKTVGCPIKLSDSPVAISRLPLLGEHTDVLRESVCGVEPMKRNAYAGRGLSRASVPFPRQARPKSRLRARAISPRQQGTLLRTANTAAHASGRARRAQ
jgi:hypothetical protein